MSRPSFRRRRDSSELEVFDATRYFSGGIDPIGFSSHAPNIIRRSFDAPIIKPAKAKKASRTIKEEKKKHDKQPTSPGFKLVGFLNSLFFPQTPSKKKKKTKSSSPLMVAREETKSDGIWKQREGEERMKRNSIGSDSSSDLFELKSFDLSNLSFGLPVYGTTDHVRVIRMGGSSFSNVTY